MTTAALEATRTLRACVFSLGGELFAAEVGYAREVIVLEEHTLVPRAPSYLVGVTNLRGAVLPILDIRPLLGLAGRRVGWGTRAIVVQAGTLQVAVVIEAVVGLEAFERLIALGDAARREWREFGMGLLERGDGLAVLLNIPKILETLRIGRKGE